MEAPFYLLLSLKTPEGYAAFGEFELAPDRDGAYQLFEELAGDPQLRENCRFHIDLIETMDTLPEKIRSKCCTLSELSQNIELIARTLFRQKNLEI